MGYGEFPFDRKRRRKEMGYGSPSTDVNDQSDHWVVREDNFPQKRSNEMHPSDPSLHIFAFFPGRISLVSTEN